MDIPKLFKEFIMHVEKSEIEIYNEFGLQFELAFFLKKELPEYKIQLERNISYFGFKKDDFQKAEIDIVIFKDRKDYKDIYVIELKAIIDQKPVRPVTVFDFVEDLRFLEQLKTRGVQGYSIFLTNNPGYYKGIDSRAGKLLTDFRNKKIEKEYQKHIRTKGKNSRIKLENSYSFDWVEIKNKHDIDEQNKLQYFIKSV